MFHVTHHIAWRKFLYSWMGDRLKVLLDISNQALAKYLALDPTVRLAIMQNNGMKDDYFILRPGACSDSTSSCSTVLAASGFTTPVCDSFSQWEARGFWTESKSHLWNVSRRSVIQYGMSIRFSDHSFSEGKKKLQTSPKEIHRTWDLPFVLYWTVFYLPFLWKLLATVLGLQ